MLLMDSVINMAEMVRASPLSGESIMPLYTELADSLNPTQGPIPPRFVFDHKAIMTATELTLGRPKVFRDIMKVLRVPYPGLWIEWEDIGRKVLRDKFEFDLNPMQVNEFRPYPQRLGFYIEADPPTPEERREGKLGYRRGRIRWVWTSTGGALSGMFEGKSTDFPNICGVNVNYDLDSDNGRVDGEVQETYFRKHPLTLNKFWQDNPIQSEALFSIWRTANHDLDPRMWHHQMSETERALLYADVVGEYIFVWACLLLLTASRETVEYRDVDTSRINKARRKSGKTPLLSHRTVHLHLRKPTQAEIKRGPLDFQRKSPHIHLVSSYIGHRDNDWWLVLPYMRGSGPPTPKTVYVHG